MEACSDAANENSRFTKEGSLLMILFSRDRLSACLSMEQNDCGRWSKYSAGLSILERLDKEL